MAKFQNSNKPEMDQNKSSNYICQQGPNADQILRKKWVPQGLVLPVLKGLDELFTRAIT
jgi:hypothetical protein